MEIIMRYSTVTGSLTYSGEIDTDRIHTIAERLPTMIYFVAYLETDITPKHLCYADPYKPHRPDKDCA